MVVAVVGTFLLGRLAYYEELAEKAKMEATVSTIGSALRTRMATLMIAGRVQDYPDLVAQNPFDWMERKPDDYRGAISTTEMAGFTQAGWYFDSAEHTLVYLPRSERHLLPDSAGLKRIRLKVTAVRPNESDSFHSTKNDSAEKIVLKPVEPYRWFDGA